MSYTDLILQDSPVSVWNLSEASGTVANNDGFLLGNQYNGTYLGTSGANVKRVKVPIVYGGGQCIKLIGNNIPSLSIPSLDKMSSANRQYSSTLEFWLKISNSVKDERVIVRKQNSATGLYIKDNYLIFRAGDEETLATSLPIDTFNKPLHIAMSYTPKGISLFVNGVKSSVTISEFDYFTKTYDINDEKFLFFGSTSLGIYVDSIAIYSYAFESTIAKRHFIYGVGYDISKFSISSKAGTMYSMHMENTASFYSLSYNSPNTWGNNLIIDNNTLEFQRDGYLTTKNYQRLEHITFSDVNYESMYSSTDGEISFPHGTSLYLSDQKNNFPNGMISKFDFTGATWTTKQLLFKIESSTNASISVYAEKQSSNYKIYYSTEFINENIEPIVNDILSTTTQVTGKIYIGFYEVNNVLSLFLYTPSNEYSVTDTGLELPLISPSLIFGSEGISSFSNTTIVPSSDLEVNRFTGKLNLVGAIKNSLVIPENFIASENYEYNYKITPSNQKKLLRYTKGTGKFYVGASFLGETVVFPHRIDLGYGEVDGDSFVKVEAKVSNATTEILAPKEILNGDPIKGLLGMAISDYVVTFNLTLESDDYDLYPPTLQYFNLNVFRSVSSTIEMKSDIGEQNIKISPKSGQDIYLPEVTKTPSMYYGNTTGLKIGDQYGQILYSTKAIGTETTEGISTIMFSAKTTTTSQCRFFYSNPVIIRQTSGTVSIAGSETTGSIYVNGVATSSAETNEWNHYIIVLDNPVPIDTVNGTLLEIGNSSANTGTFYIDNLCLLESKLSSDQASKYYNLFYSSYASPVKDNERYNINFYDKEVSHGNVEYELLPGQKTIKSTVSLSATENYTLTSNQINYSNDIDLIEIDSVSTPTLSSPIKVLLANQTNLEHRGIYNVTFSSGVATFTADTSLEASDISTGDLIYVQYGDENGKEFLQKQSNGTYNQVFLINKVISYKETDLVNSD
jgi:hypothetical protein